MNSARIIEKKIEHYGLRSATQRDLSLFTLSCVAFGYTKLLRTAIGISAHAVGGLGRGNHWHSMLNERAIAAETRALLDRLGNTVEQKILAPTRKRFIIIKKQFASIDRLIASDPESYLRRLSDVHPRYMACIGVYNCFWRFIGDGTDTAPLTRRQIAALTKERVAISAVYPRVEERIMTAMRALGKRYNIHDDLLAFCTRTEFLARAYRSPSMRRMLAKRKRKYFYLYTDDRFEFVVTGATTDAVEHAYYRVNRTNVKELRGQSAFRGIVRGTVWNVSTETARKRRMPSDMILIAPMTHPNDLSLVKKARAIVTDEGGILCHAAIVARELKKPCIIGTKIATKVFRDGQRIEVDATAGVVRKIA